MIVGIPKEIKSDEYRVGATPSNVKELIKHSHKVIVQSGAGLGSGFSDELYSDAGAEIVKNAQLLYEKATLIVKVKEPQANEYKFLNKKHTIFCYLHLAPYKELISALVESRVCAIAYETVSNENQLPLLKPMSEIAGKMSALVAAHHLNRYEGGEGILISGAHGVDPAKVLVIGAGNAGFNAAKMASGMGGDVTVINRSRPKLEIIESSLMGVKTSLYSETLLLKLLLEADIVISSVLIHGGSKTPKLITREMLKQMKKGSIIVDITIDQGGISETSRPTTHTNPVYSEEGVIHYCVANMPGAYPKTATIALTNATFDYVLKLANDGIENAIKSDASLALGVNIYDGKVTNKAVAEAQGFEFTELFS